MDQDFHLLPKVPFFLCEVLYYHLSLPQMLKTKDQMDQEFRHLAEQPTLLQDFFMSTNLRSPFCAKSCSSTSPPTNVQHKGSNGSIISSSGKSRQHHCKIFIFYLKFLFSCAKCYIGTSLFHKCQRQRIRWMKNFFIWQIKTTSLHDFHLLPKVPFFLCKVLYRHLSLPQMSKTKDQMDQEFRHLAEQPTLLQDFHVLLQFLLFLCKVLCQHLFSYKC